MSRTDQIAPTPLAVRASARPLAGDIAVPGDKSISHRALMFAGLARGITRITGLLEGEDVLRTADAMRALGAVIRREGSDWVVEGRGIGALDEPADVLDMGNSGTAARLLCGILASHDMTAVMTGDGSLRKRPMRRVTGPLAACGATFLTRSGDRLPLAVRGAAKATPITYRLPVASAQVKSALLLAGLNAHGLTRVEEPVATRDHTENMLRHFGVAVDVAPLDGGGCAISVAGPARLSARDVIVPGDPSSAAFPIAASLLVPGSTVLVRGVGLNPLRTGLLQTLREMGATLAIENERIEGGEPVGDLRVTAGALTAVDVPPERAPSMIDEYPVLAVVCAAATGRSRLRGLAELRVKESDRLSATAALLGANGVAVTIEGDDLLIEGCGGPPPGGGSVETHMDHRLAMSAVVMGLGARQPVQVDDLGFVDTSFPGFLRLMNILGAGLDV